MICGYILQRYIPEGHQRICGALSQRIEHAPWASSIRLFLLLGPNVDIPPQGPINCDIFIKYVLDDAARSGQHTRCFPRITLNID